LQKKPAGSNKKDENTNASGGRQVSKAEKAGQDRRKKRRREKERGRRKRSKEGREKIGRRSDEKKRDLGPLGHARDATYRFLQVSDLEAKISTFEQKIEGLQKSLRDKESAIAELKDKTVKQEKRINDTTRAKSALEKDATVKEIKERIMQQQLQVLFHTIQA
jgi:chromosome segregation ATPase